MSRQLQREYSPRNVPVFARVISRIANRVGELALAIPARLLVLYGNEKNNAVTVNRLGEEWWISHQNECYATASEDHLVSLAIDWLRRSDQSQLNEGNLIEGLEPRTVGEYHAALKVESAKIAAADGWQEMTAEQFEREWASVTKHFPSVGRHDPTTKIPLDKRVFEISHATSLPDPILSHVFDDLHQKLQECFDLISPGARLLVLDSEHASYYFEPSLRRLDSSKDWCRSLDSLGWPLYIFDPSYTFGIYVPSPPQTDGRTLVTLMGADLISAVLKASPIAFADAKSWEGAISDEP